MMDRDERSPRQKALQAIWESKNISDLVRIMSELPAAREPGLIDELESEAQLSPPGLKGYVSEISQGMRLVHELIAEFAALGKWEALPDWYRRSPVCFLADMEALLRECVGDHDRQGEQELADALRRALALDAEFRRRWGHMMTFFIEVKPVDRYEYLTQHPGLCDPVFHELLGIRGQHPDNGSAQTCAMREQLVHLCRVLRSINDLRSRQASAGSSETPEGWVRVVTPVSAAQAEYWYLIDGDLNDVVEPVVAQVIAGQLDLEVGRSRVLEAIDQPSPLQAVDAATYYYANLINSGPPSVFNAVLERYREILDDAALRSVDPRVRPTAVLRFAMLVAAHAQVVDRHQEVMTALIGLLDEALGVARASNGGPRLLRDLHFTRARCLEQLNRYEEAEANYSSGLEIKAAEHELAPRGRALSDLANVLVRRPGMDQRRDARILKLYEDALACLQGRQDVGSRIGVLINQGVYYNERPFDDLAANQERSLSLVQEAQSLVGGLHSSSAPNLSVSWLSDMRARVCLTYGNVLRSRYYGAPTVGSAERHDPLKQSQSNLAQAIDKYREGLRHVDYSGSPNRHTIGLLRLNLGLTCLEQYDIEGSTGLLGQAMFAFGSAIDSLSEVPYYQARAYLERGRLILETDEIDDAGQFEQSVRDIELARDMFAKVNAPTQSALAHVALGRLYLKRSARRGERPNLVVVQSAFGTAYQIYRQEQHIQEAVMIARRLAGLYVQRFRDTNLVEDVSVAARYLKEAASLLEQSWRSVQPIEWRQDVSELFSAVYGDLQWCRRRLDATTDELWHLAALSKSREILQHIGMLQRNDPRLSPHRSEYLDALRVRMHKAERARWEAQAQTDAHTSAIGPIDQWSREQSEVSLLRQLYGDAQEVINQPSVIDRLRGFQVAYPGSVVVDYTLSRFGTIALVRHADGRDSVIDLPLNRDAARALLHDERGRDGWLDVYERYREARTVQSDEYFAKRSLEWSAATREVLSKITTEVLEPTFAGLQEELHSGRLIICPGILSGLPLHAARIKNGGVPLFRHLAGFGYAPTVSALPMVAKRYDRPASVLCILADPAGREEELLKAAPTETVRIANHFDTIGVPTAIIASAGSQSGRDALARASVEPRPGIDILQGCPTPEWLSAHIWEYEYVFYTGHGLGGALIVTDEDGKPSTYSQVDLLCSPSLKLAPLFLLSACETAFEPSERATDAFHFAATLLRVGAGFVVASLWIAIETWAVRFTESFCRFIGVSGDPAIAFCQALAAVEADGSSDPICWANFAPFLGA